MKFHAIRITKRNANIPTIYRYSFARITEYRSARRRDHDILKQFGRTFHSYDSSLSTVTDVWIDNQQVKVNIDAR